MSDSIELFTVLAAPPERVYRAWMDSADHAAFVRGQAEIDARVGGEYRIFDGYITGKTTVLEPPRRVVQTWRTTEFPEESPDSILEVLFDAAGSGCRLTLKHREIPDGQGPKYEEGWKEHYFPGMQDFFGAGG
jgi:uncharacterized protein YndB with AHSA1/START domain